LLSEPGQVAVRHPRVEDRRGLVDLPGQQGVALVAGDHDPPLAGRVHDAPQRIHPQHLAGGVRRRVQPDEAGGLGPVVGIVGAHGLGTRDARPDVVGGVGDGGVHDHVARAQAQLQRQARDELLGADRHEQVLVADVRHGAHAREPLGDGGARLSGAVVGGVRVRVGRLAQGRLDERRRRVDRRADAQVDEAAGVQRGAGLGARERVPRELRQQHQSCCCGGSAATIG
jgi:hypothetical protein